MGSDDLLSSHSSLWELLLGTGGNSLKGSLSLSIVSHELLGGLLLVFLVNGLVGGDTSLEPSLNSWNGDLQPSLSGGNVTLPLGLGLSLVSSVEILVEWSLLLNLLNDARHGNIHVEISEWSSNCSLELLVKSSYVEHVHWLGFSLVNHREVVFQEIGLVFDVSSDEDLVWGLALGGGHDDTLDGLVVKNLEEFS